MLRKFAQFLLRYFIICCIQWNANMETINQRVVAQTRYGCSLDTHVFKESIKLLDSRDDIIGRIPLGDTYDHNLIFVVQQRNMDKLEQVLYDVSLPASPNYGRHWSGEQIRALTSNLEARDAIVTYLSANGATITSETLGGDFITANATISVWRKMLNTEFYTFHQRQRNGDIHQLVRAHEYSVPKELDSHIHHVLNVIELHVIGATGPTILQRSSEPIAERDNTKGFEVSDIKLSGSLLPADIREYYNLSDIYGNQQSTQAAIGLNGDYFSPNSLAYFQKNMTSQPLQPAITIGGYISESPYVDCAESNLDVQYLMGISPRSPSTYWHSAGMVAWLLDISNTVNPPLVQSVSYGAYESLISKGFHASVTTLAIKLGVMGVTLFAATGDDGAVSMDIHLCGYEPNFPAVNPYFTAVGATSVRKRLTTLCVIS
jgi:tripeptidyl-peptidase I